MMAKHIVIERPNGIVTIVRSEIETPSEEPLTEHEQIINELYGKVKILGLFSGSQRSEQLFAFIEYCDNAGWIKNVDKKRIIEDYEKANEVNMDDEKSHKQNVINSVLPEWLDKDTISDAVILWNVKKPGVNCRVKAVKLIQERASDAGYTIGLREAMKIFKKYCLYI